MLPVVFDKSSIEHGGTRAFSNIMALLTLFNEAPKRKSIAPLALKNAYLWLHWPFSMRGHETISPYVGIFVRFSTDGNFCEVLLVAGGGGVILFFLHMTMVWDLANGAGILASSDAIDVCVRSEGMGIPAPLQGQRPEDLGHRANERKPLFA